MTPRLASPPCPTPNASDTSRSHLAGGDIAAAAAADNNDRLARRARTPPHGVVRLCVDLSGRPVLADFRIGARNSRESESIRAHHAARLNRRSDRHFPSQKAPKVSAADDHLCDRAASISAGVSGAASISAALFR